MQKSKKSYAKSMSLGLILESYKQTHTRHPGEGRGGLRMASLAWGETGIDWG